MLNDALSRNKLNLLIYEVYSQIFVSRRFLVRNLYPYCYDPVVTINFSFVVLLLELIHFDAAVSLFR